MSHYDGHQTQTQQTTRLVKRARKRSLPLEDSTCEGGDDEEAETEAPDVSAGHHDDIDGLAFSSGGIFLAFGLN